MKKILFIILFTLTSLVGSAQTTTWTTLGNGNNFIVPSVPLAITATVTITPYNNSTQNSQKYASSSFTSWVADISNILDGQTVHIDYQKTTSSNLIIYFTNNPVISMACNGTVTTGQILLHSTVNGRYDIQIANFNGIYKVWITQDVN